jgi:hypothetical protein
MKASTDLAAATTPEEVVAIYMRQFTDPGEDLITAVPSMGWFRSTEKGLWVRNTFNPYVKFGRMLPEDSILDVSKPNDYLGKLRQLFTVLPINVAEEGAGRYVKVLQDEMLDDVIRTFAGGDQGEIFDLTNRVAERFAGMFKELGYTDEAVKSLTTWREASAGYVRFAMNTLEAGERTAHIPLLVSQLITGGAAVIDPAALTRVIRDAGRFKQIIRTAQIPTPLGTIQLKYSAANKWHNKNDELQKLRGQRADVDPTDFNAATRLDIEINKAETELSKLKTPDKSLPLAILKYSEIAGDAAMGAVWKPLQLVRAAFVARVVMEETLRTMASGTFGGRSGMWDYMRASFRTTGDTYNVDAAGRRWNAQISDADNLVAAKADLVDELSNVQKAIREGVDVDPLLENSLIKQVDDLQSQIDVIKAEVAEAERFYRKALLNKNRGDAYRAIMKEPKKV